MNSARSFAGHDAGLLRHRWCGIAVVSWTVRFAVADLAGSQPQRHRYRTRGPPAPGNPHAGRRPIDHRASDASASRVRSHPFGDGSSGRSRGRSTRVLLGQC